MRRFTVSTEVHFGAGVLAMLADYRDMRVFFVTDEFLVTTSFCQEAISYVPNAIVFSQVTQDPSRRVISDGSAQYLAAKPEVVVAFGGGSVMDAAKAMHHVALELGEGAEHGIVAVPTTSGSGSEVTSFAVITDEQSQLKVPIVSQYLVANVAILDPQVVVGLPAKTTADAGMDVLTHALESYVSRGASDFSDALAEKAAKLVLDHLVQCYRHGDDLAARTHMHNASCLAAMAFDNAGLGITHSLAHALGGHFPVAHGRLNAILLPHVVAFNAEHSPVAAERYTELGRQIASHARGEAAIAWLLSKLKDMNRQLDIPDRLVAAGIPAQELRQLVPRLAEAALHDGCTATNPMQPSQDDLIGILIRAS